MKERFTPSLEHDTDPDVTEDTRNIGAVPELIPEPKVRPPLPKGTVIETDLRIDLTAPDAIERLDALDRSLTPKPGHHRDNEYPTPEELAQEEKDDAERDAEDKADPFLAAYKGPPGGLTDAQAKKIRDENAAGRYDEDALNLNEAMSEKMDTVSGEIENDVELDPLAPLEQAFARDAKLANDWEETSVISDPSERAGVLLDRLNAERRDLDASDAAPDYKQARDQMLSDLSNRLRELI